MTATPIPRTVSMTLYGDLDVSVLMDHPPGRQQIHTYLAAPEQRERWWEFFRKKLREGRQGYVVAPVIDDSDHWTVASLEESYESLANGELEQFRLGLVHGRLTPAEKDAAMQAFRGGQTQVLVSTTVIEVGVDVPNATLMTIEGGERFGLSQLHQLRGRIGRGSFPGYCCLFAEAANEESRQRLEAFVGSTNGFELAEIDFALRGPGDLFGTRQHGLPPLMVADLKRDAAIVEEARRDAQTLVESDPGLSRPEHHRLRRMALTRYGRVLDLGDVG
jgi:ATP-dependent DNA helicase RecG